MPGSTGSRPLPSAGYRSSGSSDGRPGEPCRGPIPDYSWPFLTGKQARDTLYTRARDAHARSGYRLGDGGDSARGHDPAGRPVHPVWCRTGPAGSGQTEVPSERRQRPGGRDGNDGRGVLLRGDQGPDLGGSRMSRNDEATLSGEPTEATEPTGKKRVKNQLSK